MMIIALLLKIRYSPENESGMSILRFTNKEFLDLANVS